MASARFRIAGGGGLTLTFLVGAGISAPAPSSLPTFPSLGACRHERPLSLRLGGPA